VLDLVSGLRGPPQKKFVRRRVVVRVGVRSRYRSEIDVMSPKSLKVRP
jgi:hypothetical protein